MPKDPMPCAAQYLVDEQARKWEPCPNPAALRIFKETLRGREVMTIRAMLCEFCARTISTTGAAR